MGRKGSWFSAIKRVFSPRSKEKLSDGQEKKRSKEKKKGRGGESKSLIPLFREASSIEKILGDVDEERTFQAKAILPYSPTLLPRIASPAPPLAGSVASPPRTSYQKVASPNNSPPRPTVDPPKAASPRIPHSHKDVSYRPQPTSRDLQISATKIQTAYRGYTARRSFRALRGLVRLQGVLRAQNVKRQTLNAMKLMQLLVRVQTQIHSRRTQMLQRQQYKNDKEMETTFSKWTYNQLVDGNNQEWDDSVITKEEREERLRKRVEAVIKRERAMSYASSHQSQTLKPRQKLAQAALGGFPKWGNWLENQQPSSTASELQVPVKNIDLTPPRQVSQQMPSPLLQTSNYKHDNNEQLTPKSSMPIRGKQLLQTPSRTPPSNGSTSNKYPRPRATPTSSRFGVSMRDDDSLTSCPPFSLPNYMQPTVSAKAKVRANSNPKERVLGTPGNDSKRRFSFPLTPNIGPFKWNRGSNKDSSSQKVVEKQQSVQSTDDHMSMGSAVSMPAVVGRKTFNRFV